MEYITSTQIRSQFPKALAMLRLGKTVRIIHRSKIVGLINPPDNTNKKVFTKKDAKAIRTVALQLNLPKLSDKEIEKRYRAAMTKKTWQTSFLIPTKSSI